MEQAMNLKDAERRAWTLYLKDGLWDLFFGFLFLAGGLRTLTDTLWSYLLVVVGLLVFFLGRRLITLPRLGEIKFGKKRKAQRQMLLIVIMAAVALTLGVFLLGVWGAELPGSIVGLLFAVLVPAILVVVAYFLDFKRLYVYAALVAIFMLLTEMVSLQVGAMVQVGTGLIALIIGLRQFLRFLREYPVVEEAPMGDGEIDEQS